MRGLMICTGVAVIFLLGLVRSASGCSLPPPFNTEPFNTDAKGNAAANLFGCFRQNGGPKQFRYFLGTNDVPGSLILDFARPFTDGPGNDFAILTNSQSWGPLADMARFDFYLGGNLQASFMASLAPDRLFEFELPGSGLVVDRVVITNITPDPPGIEGLAGMTFDDAGVAYVAGEFADICLQDDSSGNLLQINTTTGEYQFTNCGGLTVGGIGTVTKRGSMISLQHNAPDRRVTATIDTSSNRATASIQLFAQGWTFSLTDRDITNNTCACK
jgi:hypothetical protein